MVILQYFVEFFSDVGVVVFVVDIKGDLCGIVVLGNLQGKVVECIVSMLWLNYQLKVYLIMFWDIVGKIGYLLCIIISEMGLLLLVNFLELIDSQQVVLFVVFQVVDWEGLLLFDLKDLKVLFNYLKDNLEIFGEDWVLFIGVFGQVLLCCLVILEQQGVEVFFGEFVL